MRTTLGKVSVKTKLLFPALAFIALGYAGPALSASLSLSYSTTNNGVLNVTTGTGVNNALAVPSTYTYGNGYTGPTPNIIPGSTSTLHPAGFGFYDDYIFTITGATANSISTTIDLGTPAMLQISDFQERLYNWTNNTGITIGAPNGGAIDAWTSPIGTVGTVAVLNATTLAPGTYVLQMRGIVTGTFGGSYAGTLNLVPVPLPAALPMMLTGLGLLGGVMRRRKS